MKYSGSIDCMGLSSATDASAVKPREAAASPLTSATPISGKAMASASAACAKSTAWSVKSRAWATRMPLCTCMDRSPASMAPSLKVTRKRPVFIGSPPPSSAASSRSSVLAATPRWAAPVVLDTLAALFLAMIVSSVG